MNFTTGAFLCRACCVSGNDIIDYVMVKQHVNFNNAMKWIVDRWKIKADNESCFCSDEEQESDDDD